MRDWISSIKSWKFLLLNVENILEILYTLKSFHISKIFGDIKNHNKIISIFNCNFWLKVLKFSTKIGTFDPFVISQILHPKSREIQSRRLESNLARSREIGELYPELLDKLSYANLSSYNSKRLDFCQLGTTWFLCQSVRLDFFGWKWNDISISSY